MTRKVMVVWHRYAGLLMTLFLVVVGITGSLLAFTSELERLVAPQLFATDRSGAPLDAATLIQRSQAIDARVRVFAVSLKEEGRAQLGFQPRLDPQTGKPFTLDFTQIFIDPYTGKELGRRRYGDISQGMVNLMPFIRQLHMNLVWGRTGTQVLGWIALLWTLDCFAAFYLTLPRWSMRTSATPGRSWFVRWWPSWLVKWGRDFFPLNYALHRASGLWVWAMLLMFAWSSVYLNLHNVYASVTGAVLDYPEHNNHGGERRLSKPVENPALDWRSAVQHAEDELVKAGLTLRRVESLSYSPRAGVYTYRVATDKDFQTTGGRTYVLINGNTGELSELRLPSGQHSGLTFTNWIYALHMGNVFGLPYRLLVFVAGLIVALLSVTGVYIWWKKLAFRRYAARQVATSGEPKRAAVANG